MTERVVVIGNRKLAKYVLHHLIRTDWSVVGAISASGELATAQANYESVADLCDHHEIPLHKTSDINSDATQEWLVEQNPTLCLCPGWSQIIQPAVLNIPDRFLGFHASDLPHGRGGAPINWQIISGTDSISLSLFEYVEGVDAGPIFEKEEIPIQQRDTVATVLERLAIAAMTLCDRIMDTVPKPNPQSTADATYRPRRQPQDGIIDWSWSAQAIHDWVRAQTKPYPGAYSFFDGEKIRIWEADMGDSTEKQDTVPGTIINKDKQSVTISTGEGHLNIKRIQRDGHPEQWADEWATAVGIEAGDRLTRTAAPKEWTYTGIRGSDGRFDYDTSLSPKETGNIQIISYSGDNDPPLDFEVQYGSELIHQDELPRNGGETSVVYPAPDTTTNLTVTYYDGSECIDRRLLKIYPKT